MVIILNNLFTIYVSINDLTYCNNTNSYLIFIFVLKKI